MVKVHSLGHVVIYVRDQQRAEAFYHGLLGLPIAVRSPRAPVTFFTLGNHHDFAVAAVGEDAQDPPAKSVGLFHVAFKIGDSVEELREAKVKLEDAGLKTRAVDHIVTQSLYFHDPDGNMIEFYVDDSDGWKQGSKLVVTSMPLEL